MTAADQARILDELGRALQRRMGQGKPWNRLTQRARNGWARRAAELVIECPRLRRALDV